MEETAAIEENRAARRDVPDGAILAAIDMGSNSFHLIVARVEHDEVRPVETLSEKVQLGAGLKHGALDKAAMRRGMDCLSRFKQVLDSVSPLRTRIVGTNALRQASNRRDFTAAAEALLGVPIDVIYGREEARLVYLGVAHTLSDDEHSRLVVDIGGGSTEFIVGQRFEPLRLDSLQMGCVSYARQFFKRGAITPKRYIEFGGAAGGIPHTPPLRRIPLGRLRRLLRHPAGHRVATGQFRLDGSGHYSQRPGRTRKSAPGL